jgi:predicted O-linked N-acetylglucosamine transferase (SPINDLY family)
MPNIDPIPTTTEVERIVAISDPILRNLQITQCYHELAVALTLRTGMCANWCTFAVWASKQAGQTIRQEDFARLFDTILSAQAAADVVPAAQGFGSPCSDVEIQETVTQVLNPLAALERASIAVARGNRKVFEEIGREFARFIEMCFADTAFDQERIAQFCAGLRPGEPPMGQQYLRQAFTRYYRAFFEPDAKTCAELMLLANIEIGLHEQTRLQPEIVAAMTLPLEISDSIENCSQVVRGAH